MSFDALSPSAIFFAAVVAVIAWLNLQPAYQHHRFIDQVAGVMSTMVYFQLVIPVFLEHQGPSYQRLD